MKKLPPARLHALPPPQAGGGDHQAEFGAEGRWTAASSFCGRCGRPPHSDQDGARVCAHCGLGLVLRTVAGAPPRHTDGFLIVDRRLAVSAVSLRAEVLLGVDQDAAIGRPVIELVAANGEQPLVRHDFLASLRAAARGTGPLRRFDGQVTSGPEQRLTLRVAPCGPPPGALLVLSRPTA